MRYTILVVEDEPASAENLCDIIRLYCPQYEVVDRGENGEEGLSLCRRLRPDLVLTDIRMPRMDGLALIRQLRQELPQVHTVIVSGYQDFEYARTALQHGAIDYLLKPVGPATLRAVLGRVAGVLAEELRQRRIHLIRRMAGGEEPLVGELEKCFPAPSYRAALIRQNGLPSRFSPNTSAEISSGSGEVLDLYGRDELESLYICPAEALAPAELATAAEKPYRAMAGYTTTVLWGAAFPIREVPQVVGELYRLLDNRTTIGLTQTISAPAGKERQPALAFAQELHGKLEHYGRGGQREPVRRLLAAQLARWEVEQRPQLSVEGAVRMLLGQLQYALGKSALDQSVEFMVDDAFYYATCYDDLRESLLDIVDKLLPHAQSEPAKVDTPAFFAAVRQYIDDNMAQGISLQSVCKEFSISQTYLSRLFRKYAQQSFNSYLTQVRMERAKALLAGSEILIKDVAAMVGFADQFYFSRLFRAYTGKSPTEFVAGTNAPPAGEAKTPSPV